MAAHGGRRRTAVSAFKPTASQQAAIETRGSAVLVSAGAGSGKTKVLTERLMGFVTDSKNPADLDSFLIITFTRAAAAELRSKIAAELSRRLSESVDDAHLQRQTLRVYQADIKTVDAFCTALLRENTHLLDTEGDTHALTPDFRVLDDGEAKLLRQRVLNRVLEEFYADLNEGRRQLAGTLGAGRDDRALAELVLKRQVTLQDALSVANDPVTLRNLCGRC
jgi:ATP-dependent helicase/nuclease subunit A